MSEKCIYCDEEISGQEGKWGFSARPLRWIHYSCIEKLWSIYKSVNQSIDNDTDKYSEREHTLSKDCWCNPTIVNKNGYEYHASTRVRCTKDGDYPEDKETVFAEIHGQYYDGITHKLDFDKDNGLWLDYDGENIPHIPEEMTVYWQPLTSLKEQYEKQKEEV
jgi:hypothetical protein